jgi:hypothetical protein
VGTVAFGPDADPEAVVDDLVAAGVLAATDEGLHLTDEFHAAKGVYDDSYETDERVRETVADLFGVDPEGERARAVTADELAALLALRSFLDDPPPVEALAVAAGVVAGVGPSSPVPETLREVDDDSWRDAVDGGDGDAVLTVWKRHCEPCDAMKADLDAVLAELRAVADVPVAGLDGEACPGFCRDAGVNAAPAVVCVRDGEVVEAVTGRRSPEALADLFADVYA